MKPKSVPTESEELDAIRSLPASWQYQVEFEHKTCGHATGPWYVVRSAFHRGGIISRHALYANAARAARKCSEGGCPCVCGCASVIHSSMYRTLPLHYEAGHGSQPARRG